LNIGRASFALFVLFPLAALAVNPLVVDDADTVEPGRLQLNSGWQFSGTGSVRLQTLPVNPVFGVHPRGELGLIFGYQWRDGHGADSATADADGITDLTLATKRWLWQTKDEEFKMSARLDLKLPTASESRGLGTGNADVGAVLIATRCLGRTCLDWNVGYTATDASSGVFGDDHWFLGQAVRHQLNERWTLLGEIYALLPQENTGASSTLHFNGGAQFNVRENFLISALIGSAVGRGSPNFTAYVGFTWVF
jgi:hypothetical protein